MPRLLGRLGFARHSPAVVLEVGAGSLRQLQVLVALLLEPSELVQILVDLLGRLLGALNRCLGVRGRLDGRVLLDARGSAFVSLGLASGPSLRGALVVHDLGVDDLLLVPAPLVDADAPSVEACCSSAAAW